MTFNRYEDQPTPDYEGDESLVDEDTPKSFLTIKSLHNTSSSSFSSIFELVMSDEFNADGRSFEAGADSKWTSLTEPGSSAS